MLRILYWLAVLAISLALLIVLVLFLESRDDSSLSGETRSSRPVLLTGPG